MVKTGVGIEVVLVEEVGFAGLLVEVSVVQTF